MWGFLGSLASLVLRLVFGEWLKPKPEQVEKKVEEKSEKAEEQIYETDQHFKQSSPSGAPTPLSTDGLGTAGERLRDDGWED